MTMRKTALVPGQLLRSVHIRKITLARRVTQGCTRADQDTGGALLEFPVRTAMHGKSRVSFAIKYDSF